MEEQLNKDMQSINYNGYTIIATAFKNEDDKWIGQARLRQAASNPIGVQTPLVFDNEQFTSKQKAEDFALDGAQFFIDTQLKDSGSE
ncbi:hypothetical protein KW786_01395 [Candidatus Parcubacteria bacterium]|nr:hypothetical protein [Candidatus Parcubacteria bacterium]